MRALDQQRRGRPADHRGASSHDAGDGHRPSGIGDHKHLGIERPLRAVERDDRLSLARPAHADLAPVERVMVERVNGMAELPQDVVGGVHDVVHRTEPDRRQARRQPVGAVGDRHTLHHPGAVPPAQLRLLDRHTRQRIGRGRRSILLHVRRVRAERSESRGRCLARDAVDVHAVGAVGEDLDIEHGVAVGRERRRLDGQTGGGQPAGQIGGGAIHLDELADPGETELHEAPRN